MKKHIFRASEEVQDRCVIAEGSNKIVLSG